MKTIVTMILSLGIGYFLYPTINSSSQSPVAKESPMDFELLVSKISQQSSKIGDAEADDQMLVHEVLYQNNLLEQKFLLELHEVMTKKEIREKAILRSTLLHLKTPEAQQALLNLTLGKVSHSDDDQY